MRSDPPAAPTALTFDLDDTLWPIWPTISRAEAVLRDWLVQHAPATAARFDAAGLRRVRDELAIEHPQWLHDLSAIRRESIRRALVLAGEDPALAEPAFECFFAERQRVDLYEDALPALERLAARFPILALSNGNADLGRIGLDRHFVGALSAREFGIPKPRPEIFHEACRRLGVPPAQVLHVGDDLDLDVHGALGAGLGAAWIDRSGQQPGPAGALRLPDLLRLAETLGC
jgi:2-haloalkanoic acid dehalogenase type II